jgi:hypothetical protein
LAEIQDWWFNRPQEPTLTIQPQLGEAITLDRSRPLRVLSKEEESGGRTAGNPKPIVNILGDKVFSLPEKAVGDALIAHLTDMARRYNNGEEMRLPNVVEAAFDKYGLKSRIDDRLDVLHGKQGVIAQVSKEEADVLKANADAQKKNFNTFFFSLAKAVRDNEKLLFQVKTILMQVLPQWEETWRCLDSIMFVEEELTPGVFRPEGAVLKFSAGNRFTPLVTEIDFRPSGTDSLKSKVYLDAEVLGPEVIAEFKKGFDALKLRDLYSVLDHHMIQYAEPKPALADQIGL